MTRGLHRLALTCALSLAFAPVIARAADGPAPAAPADAGPAREKALLAYERDLVSVLSPRADAMPLFAAALLARPLTNLPKINDFHALIDRAARADGAADIAAAISWLQLADCDAKADACPNSAALEHLQTLAPDNAAVWLLKLGDDTRNMKQAAVRDDLAKAANARLYDDYTGTSLQALAGSIGTLPPPADTYDAANPSGALGVQTVLLYGLASSQPQPALQVMAKLCDSAGSDAAIKADCLKLGKTLEWGSSPLGRSLGLHLREVLSDDPSQQADAKQARLSLIWQVQNFARLLDQARTDAATAQHLVTLARRGGTEMSVLLTALRDAKMPTDAPADWKPQGAKQPQG